MSFTKFSIPPSLLDYDPSAAVLLGEFDDSHLATSRLLAPKFQQVGLTKIEKDGERVTVYAKPNVKKLSPYESRDWQVAAGRSRVDICLRVGQASLQAVHDFNNETLYEIPWHVHLEHVSVAEGDEVAITRELESSAHEVMGWIIERASLYAECTGLSPASRANALDQGVESAIDAMGERARDRPDIREFTHTHHRIRGKELHSIHYDEVITMPTPTPALLPGQGDW